MSLFRSGIKKLVNINIIIFDNFVKLKTNFKIPPNEFILKEHKAIRIEDLNKLKLNNTIKDLIKFHEESYYFQQLFLSRVSDKLKIEIKTNTYFERNFQEWNITNFLRKYNIEGKELFLQRDTFK